jgi:hypothetical protein
MQIRGQLHTPVPLSPGTVGLVSKAQETGWTPEPIWTSESREKSLAPYGIRIKIHSIDHTGELRNVPTGLRGCSCAQLHLRATADYT